MPRPKKIQHVGLHANRTSREANEKIFAEEWAVRNKGSKNSDQNNLLSYLLSTRNSEPDIITQRDAEVAATVIQWLGSLVGSCFLTDVHERIEQEQKSKKTKK